MSVKFYPPVSIRGDVMTQLVTTHAFVLIISVGRIVREKILVKYPTIVIMRVFVSQDVIQSLTTLVNVLKGGKE